MTIEEKAKRYDETLEQLKGLIEGTREDKCAIVEEDIIGIFPELAESEDERIRKKLVDLLYKVYANTNYITCAEHEEAVAWLEKQTPKPKWTEEDSSMQLMLMRDIEHVSFISKEGKDERIMWLNKLDDRFHQNTNDIQKSKWSDEDEENLNDLDVILFEYKDMPKENYWHIINWLKSIKQKLL